MNEYLAKKNAGKVIFMGSWEKFGRLVDYMKGLDSVLVAFSGGVDSLLLLDAAIEALGRERVLAVTAASVIRSPEEREEALRLAVLFGARWVEVESGEMRNTDFVANPPERCYHCKKDLLSLLGALASREGLAHIVEGSNKSDLDDFRPGYRAVRESGALSPLLEAGISKDDVREILKARGTAGWDRPSEACLCSRVPYGTEITEGKLKRIYLAEKAVKTLGLVTLRVRDHGDTARLEVPAGEIEKICREENREFILQELKGLGYKHVTVDLGGYRTGNMN
ncbi:MAG: ATP-dependent sacrificial sulfur transferase LarE [Actinobacteria bacterium]|nr:ATP-dependent sacrificial sulfur transferase LarE [Actinomycetota bacterium]